MTDGTRGAPGDNVVRLDGPTSAPAVATPPARSVLDCGPGGCGGFGSGQYGGGGGWAGGLGGLITPGLDRTSIDDLMSDALMRKIVTSMVDDALKVRPTLAGDDGELSSVLDWQDERGYWPAMRMALIYARMYGGGGIVCFVDDGRRSDEEVDPLAARDVVGYYALPKWYLVPSGSGSGRVRAGWYGPRIGRPEYYDVTASTGFATPPESVRALEEAAERAEDDLPPGAPRPQRVPSDVRKILNVGGARFHRSRIIPFPHCDEMDLRLARWMPHWMGWGPGIVEGCVSAFMNRRQGALRIGAIMRSVVVNTVEMTDLEHRQSTPDLGAAVRERLEQIKWCLQFMDDALPLVATDPMNKFGSLTHQVAGIDKLVAAQRQFLLDTIDTPGVRIFGDSVGGLNGGDRGGEWRQWYDAVKAYEETMVWSAGAFGGGLHQAVNQSMICSRGPTDGRMDPTVRAVWPNQWTESARDKAETRLKNAQARAQDKLTLDLTSAALRRHDPTVQEDYPSLDLDEAPLPVLTPATPGHAAPGGTTAAVRPAGEVGEETAQSAAATTPSAVNKAVAEEAMPEAEPTADAPPLPPAILPQDIHSVAQIAEALGMTKAAVSRTIAAAGIQPFLCAEKGTRGGDRYELGKVLAAWQAQARARADAMRAPTYMTPEESATYAARLVAFRVADDGRRGGPR